MSVLSMILIWVCYQCYWYECAINVIDMSVGSKTHVLMSILKCMAKLLSVLYRPVLEWINDLYIPHLGNSGAKDISSYIIISVKIEIGWLVSDCIADKESYFPLSSFIKRQLSKSAHKYSCLVIRKIWLRIPRGSRLALCLHDLFMFGFIILIMAKCRNCHVPSRVVNNYLYVSDIFVHHHSYLWLIYFTRP